MAAVRGLGAGRANEGTIVGQWDKTFIHAGQQGDECAITSLEAVFCLFLRVTMTLPAYLIKQVQINFVHSTYLWHLGN
jgi:hypothetical protein